MCLPAKKNQKIRTRVGNGSWQAGHIFSSPTSYGSNLTCGWGCSPASHLASQWCRLTLVATSKHHTKLAKNYAQCFNAPLITRLEVAALLVGSNFKPAFRLNWLPHREVDCIANPPGLKSPLSNQLSARMWEDLVTQPCLYLPHPWCHIWGHGLSWDPCQVKF